MNVNQFVMARSATAEEFHCARCGQDKKAKAKATNPEGLIVCNGCYGWLKANS